MVSFGGFESLTYTFSHSYNNTFHSNMWTHSFYFSLVFLLIILLLADAIQQKMKPKMYFFFSFLYIFLHFEWTEIDWHNNVTRTQFFCHSSIWSFRCLSFFSSLGWLSVRLAHFSFYPDSLMWYVLVHKIFFYSTIEMHRSDRVRIVNFYI